MYRGQDDDDGGDDGDDGDDDDKGICSLFILNFI